VPAAPVEPSAASRGSEDRRPEAGNPKGFDLPRIDVVDLTRRFPNLALEYRAA
jgi:hypothetical protein